ncbi:FUSC family protein [Streptomyces sp. NPDC093225]|uniref:FUSC family protein n=1 Tax=Streptomyces sp. NPDC093225 TaxID=3366034 RepID=UPI00381DA316
MGGVGGGRIPSAYAGAARRAVRIALVASAGFYAFLYGLDRPVAATYALFGSVSLAGLSRIPGTGPQRAAQLVRLLPVCWLLVVIGTYLSVRTWTAVVGMLVIGFVLTFVAVGGPRLAGAGPGLQLLYILPSFPPYDPDSLGDRLLGTTVGLVLLVLAEALVFPEPPPPSYPERAARALETAADCARRLSGPPYALPVDSVRAAQDAGTSLRALRVPEAERPAGPGVRERARAHTGLATRTLLARLARLPAVPPGRDPARSGTEVLGAVAAAAADAAARLRSGAAPGATYEALRAARGSLADRPSPPGSVPAAALRREAAVLEVADTALTAATAADLAVRGRAAAVERPVADRLPASLTSPDRFWYAGMRAPELWWHRLSGHAGRRSVFFQNAVRISLALAAARLVAGVDTLPHGFWAMLAALTLTRTTVGETWRTVRVALAGTLIGVTATAALLTAAGGDSTVYAAVLPVLLLVTFTLGPVRGVGWAQAFFSMTVATVFAQLATANWHLAEFRLLDVLIGSTIGCVFGLLAWPRGAHDELRRAGAGLLRRAAEIVVATTASLAAEAGAVGAADGTDVGTVTADAVAGTPTAVGAAPSAGTAVGVAAARAGPATAGAAAARTGTPSGARETPGGVFGRRSLTRAVVLAESAYAQFASETPAFGGATPGTATGAGTATGTGTGTGTAIGSTAGTAAGPQPQPQPQPQPLTLPGTDWQAALMAGHHTLWGAGRLTAAVAVPPLSGPAAEALTRLGDRVAGRMLLVSAALDPGGDTPSAPVPLRDPAFDGFAAEPDGAPRLYYAAVSWLDALMTDLERVVGGPDRAT